MEAQTIDTHPVTPALMQLNEKPPPRMVRGRGSWLWDEHGRAYLDFIQGWAVNCLGHSPELLRQALDQQLDAVLNAGPAFHNGPSHALAALLGEVSGLPRVFVSGSGAEANETAIKLARKWGQLHKQNAYEVITTVDSFHGRTLAMSCATGKPGFATFPPELSGFTKVPYGDVAAVASALHERTVAVMVEPVQGEAGAVMPPPGYLRELRALCDRQHILLIADEVQTGMARTGPLFACQAEGVLPDIMTLGKGLGGGLPVSATLARADVACFALGEHGGTFAAHALLSAGALAVTRHLLTPAHIAQREHSANRLMNALQTIACEHSLGLRGRGHLWGLVLPEPRAVELRDRCFAQGLLVNAARPNVLRLMPSLEVSDAEIERMAAILRAALSA